jgi:sucrose-6-phosphate hydrolase SacC (GH32 family)
LFAYESDEEKWALGQDVALISGLRKNKIYTSRLHFSSRKNKIQSKTLPDVSGRYMNIVATFSSNNKLNDCKFGLKVASNAEKSDTILYDGATGKLHVQHHMIDLNLPDNNSKKMTLNVYLDGSALEVFISKYNKNGVTIPYQVYSAPLSNNGNLNQESIKVMGIEGVSAEVEIYSMDTCWVNQEL